MVFYLINLISVKNSLITVALRTSKPTNNSLIATETSLRFLYEKLIEFSMDKKSQSLQT